jgi:hypothetical protein
VWTFVAKRLAMPSWTLAPVQTYRKKIGQRWYIVVRRAKQPRQLDALKPNDCRLARIWYLQYERKKYGR